MRKRIRGGLLRALKASGIFDSVGGSRWRQRRLLILCYHSLALDEENLWRPANFLTPIRLRERFEILKHEGYSVLPLGEALERLRRNDLAPRSVVLTFDDGTYDFYKLTYPLLKEYGFPATVYQTTYYCDRQMPVYSLICAYMLWKRRETVLRAAPQIRIVSDFPLGAPEARQTALSQIIAFEGVKKLSSQQKSEDSTELGQRLEEDYSEMLCKRVLQLMTAAEI